MACQLRQCERALGQSLKDQHRGASAANQRVHHSVARIGAVAYKHLGLFALVEMVIFIATLAIGLVYAWKKGALEWV